MLAEFQYILHLLRYPDTAVITERFAHQGQLALLVAVNGNTGGMDLRKAGIGKECTLLVALPGCGSVGVHRVGREEVGVAVSAGRKYHGMGAEALQFTGNEVAGDNALC